jgi:hypothetical protein
MAMEYPLLKLEELRMRYRYKRVSWPVTVALFGVAGVVVTLLVVWMIVANEAPFNALGGICFTFFNLFGQLMALLGIPGAAGACLASERESGALDSLFLTPLSTGQIVWQKALATLRTLLPMGVFLLPFLLMSFVTDEEEQFGFIPIAILDLFIAAGFYVCVGLLASAFAKTAQHGRGAALAIALGVVLFLWLGSIAFVSDLGFHIDNPLVAFSLMKSFVFVILGWISYRGALARMAYLRTHL